MGSHHNLFGHPNEAQVVIDNDGRFHVTKIIPGSRIQDMMNFARYDRAQLCESYRRQLSTQVAEGKLTQAALMACCKSMISVADRSTYLD